MKKETDKEKIYNCTNCKKRCVPAAFIKSKGQKERCYCNECLKKLMKPNEF